MIGRVRLLVVRMVAAVVVCGTVVVSAFEPGRAGPASTSKRAALEVSVVVSQSCNVRTTADFATAPLSLVCNRGTMPAGMTPRVEIIPPRASPSGASGPLVPSAQNSILTIHF
jgi:hypothetical protein